MIYRIDDAELANIGPRGRARVTVRIDGYWSSDPINLYVERKVDYRDEGKAPVWEITMSHSSGGRLASQDGKHYRTEDGYVAVADDLEAEANFGAALVAMAEFGRGLRACSAEFELAYQKAKREREEARQKAIEADVPPTYQEALSFIHTTMAKLSDADLHAVVEVRMLRRGDRQGCATMTFKKMARKVRISLVGYNEKGDRYDEAEFKDIIDYAAAGQLCYFSHATLEQ